jgi:HAD superfamily hydrolase (TIGR01509 family)
MRRALILDCDGTLADTERTGHLVAFNQMFAELGLPFHWTEEEYGELIRVAGGKERMASQVTPELARQLGLPADPARLVAAVTPWHRRKTEIYRDLIASGQVPPRPGVRRLIAQALAEDWQVAVASTAARDAVEAVLRVCVGEERVDRVPIYTGDLVTAKKPAPDIYLHAFAQLGADRAVVVEDLGIGCQAALAAGLPAIITVTRYSAGDDFTGATLVLSDLGEPGRPAEVLSDPQGLAPDGVVDVAVLDRVAAASSRAAAPSSGAAAPSSCAAAPSSCA